MRHLFSKFTLAIILGTGSYGCSSLTTRISCTVAGDKLFATTQYRGIGFTGEAATEDAKAICSRNAAVLPTTQAAASAATK